MSWQSEEYKHGNPPSGRFVVECALCGFDYYKDTLKRRSGLLVCHHCFDQKAVREQLPFEPEIGPTSSPRTDRRIE